MSPQRVFGGEHALTDGTGGQLAVQLHVVVQALPPAEHLATDGTGRRPAVARRRRRSLCERPRAVAEWAGTSAQLGPTSG